MPNSILSQIERRLIESRVPTAKRKRALQELSEHREDIMRAAVADGLCENEATAHADQSLGDPTELANKIVQAARASSWPGRHPFAAFCILPFFSTPFAIAAAFLMVLRITPPRGPEFHFNFVTHAFEMTNAWAARVLICHLAQLAVTAALASIFCKLATASASARFWMLTACGICSVQCCWWTVLVSGGGFSMPPGSWPTPAPLLPLESAIIPIVIALSMELHQRRLLLFGGQHV